MAKGFAKGVFDKLRFRKGRSPRRVKVTRTNNLSGHERSRGSRANRHLTHPQGM